MPDIKMTPKHPVIGVDKELICKNDTVTYFDKNTRSEYTGIVIDIYPRSNTVLFHELNNEFEKRVDAYACKIKKHNTINVYILTEEGREYTREGCEYVKNLLKENFGETNELIFSMGYAYNESDYLLKELDLHPDSYLAISTDHGITTVNPDGIPVFKKALKDFPNQTSWKTACMVFEDTD